MKTITRTLVALFAVVMAVLFLPACTTDGGDNPALDYTPNLQIDKNIAETIKIGIKEGLATGIDAEKAILEDVAALLKKDYPNVKVEIVTIYGDYNLALMNAHRSGSMPDIIFTESTSASELFANGIFLNLKRYVEAGLGIEGELNPAEFVESAWKWGQIGHDGDQYFIPRSYDRIVTHLNADVFAQAKVPLPQNNDWTWEDFLDVCDKLKKSDVFKNDSVNHVVDTYMGWDPIFDAVLSSCGADIIDKNGNVTVDSAATRAGLEMLMDLKTKKYSDQRTGGFQGGKSAMAFHSYTAQAGRRYIGEAKYNVVTFPRIGDNPMVGAGAPGFSVYAHTTADKRDLAWQYLKRLLSKDGQEAMAVRGMGSVPVRKDMQNPAENKWGEGFETINMQAFSYQPELDKHIDFYLNVDGKFQGQLVRLYRKLITNYIADGYSLDNAINICRTEMEGVLKDEY
ncbi:MAG: extracellular solute-binding protein [Clostridiales bacterium]|jgi:multiple sugar transport system substrate-binding protein|nr:extracellular solute-binding protein [Clostridiales bacterium]